MENKTIIWGFIAIIAMIATFGIGIYAGNNGGKIETIELLQPQIDTLIQENAQLKNTIKERENTTNENTQLIGQLKIENQTLKLNYETIKKDIAITNPITISCYWATEYLNDYEGTINHFNGIDYSKEYIYNCLAGANEHWDTMTKYKEE